MKIFTITIANTAAAATELVEQGFCPVECSFGSESVVDGLTMDHHGTHADLEAVAIRAYRDHFAARAEDPRFVIGVNADADAAFAVAALAGLLPHPDRNVEGVPPHIAKGLTADLTGLAETVSIIDTDPVGRDLSSMAFGSMLMTWNAMYGGGRDDLAAAGAVQGWVRLTTGNPAQLRPYMDAAKVAEQGRREAAIADITERARLAGRACLILNSRVFGFDVWYGRQEDMAGPDVVRGWANPVVVALTERGENITIGCPNEAVAEQLFGKGGLANLFPHLGEGWGGRAAVGGSPRGQKMTEDDLKMVAEVIQAQLQE